MEYGPESLDVVDDIGEQELKEAKTKYLESNIEISTSEIEQIEEKTRDQSSSSLWVEERKKRLTSSAFGKIVKRKTHIAVKPVVKSLLYSKFSGNIATNIGLNNEQIAKDEYMKRKENTVVSIEPMGLVISHHRFLAASPDGKVICRNGDVALIEIKNVLYNKAVTLTQAASMKSINNFCLEIRDGELKLKTKHDYFYQCLGLLHITNYKWLDFVVRTENPYELHVERVTQDCQLWNTMLPKLTAFYLNAVLPELAAPREGKIPGIREPGIWYENSTKTKAAKHSTKPIQTTQIEPPSQVELPSTSNSLVTSRSRRGTKVKFVGRRIKHQWKVNQSVKWFCGTVLGVVRGEDGVEGVYEIQYDNEDEPCEVDHLIQDFKDGQVKFIDL